MRSRDEDVPNDEGEFAIGVLTGITDESLDLSEDELETAENTARSAKRSVQRSDYRDARPPQRGLLVIYLIQNPDDPWLLDRSSSQFRAYPP